MDYGEEVMSLSLPSFRVLLAPGSFIVLPVFWLVRHWRSGVAQRRAVSENE
jgi:hypothetical protein